jgi:hypothetical protein
MARHDLPRGTWSETEEPGCMAPAIEGIGPSDTARIGGRRPVRASVGFQVPAETSVSSHAATEASPAAALTSLLTLQELGGETVEDRESRRHGQTMLAVLAELQRALLTGCDAVAALDRLADLLGAVPRATDRRLAAMVSAIVVRARVELARRRV